MRFRFFDCKYNENFLLLFSIAEFFLLDKIAIEAIDTIDAIETIDTIEAIEIIEAIVSRGVVRAGLPYS